MTTRRNFLASILASAVAPAVVSNPMKLWVPRLTPDNLVLLDDGIRLPRELFLWSVPAGLVRLQGHKLDPLPAKNGYVWTRPKPDLYLTSKELICGQA